MPRPLFYWCRIAVRQTVIFCRTDVYLQDWRNICCQNIIFFAKIHRTFVRQTKNFAGQTEIKALQALHHAPPLHLHQASAITLSKMKSNEGALVFP